MTDIKHIVKWNYYYNKIGKSVSWGYDKSDSHVIDFIDNYNHKKDDSVLDVGCGFGKNAKIFIDRGIKYTGIDISKTAIFDATKNYKKGEFIFGNFLKYDFKTKFNFIVDAGCIHVNPPEEIDLFLDKYFDLLEDEGKLFVRIFKSETDTTNPLFYIDKILPVWGYTEKSIKSHINKDKFIIDKFILDENYYEEDDVFYLYLIKKG